MITLLISGAMLTANTTDVYVHVLSDNEWKTIEETAEMDAMLDIDEVPISAIASYTVLSTQDWNDIEKQAETDALLNQEGILFNPICIVTTLTEADWAEIKESAELDAMLDF